MALATDEEVGDCSELGGCGVNMEPSSLLAIVALEMCGHGAPVEEHTFLWNILAEFMNEDKPAGVEADGKVGPPKGGADGVTPSSANTGGEEGGAGNVYATIVATELLSNILEDACATGEKNESKIRTDAALKMQSRF